jgi:hypothetical protein
MNPKKRRRRRRKNRHHEKKLSKHVSAKSAHLEHASEMRRNSWLKIAK